ncbi:MAG: hypothetical protein Q4A34_04145 [Candidatus Saccharibacteria bacterium]|nr:hypothetical protein [Candidatus Saccharibacteria bacterium]
MILDDTVTKVEFNKLNVGDCVIITTGSGSTYRLTVKEQLYTKEGLVVSTIVRIDKKLREPLLWQHLGFGIITSVRKGYSAVFTEAAGYESPFTRTSWVRSLTLLQPEA